MNCPKCQVSLSRAEAKSGTCPLCGWEKQRQNRLQARKAQSSKAQPQPQPKVQPKAQPKVQAVFQLSIHSAGYIEGQGFTVSKQDTDPRNWGYRPRTDHFVIVLDNGQTFVGNAILTAIAGNWWQGNTGSQILKVGRATLHQLTAQAVDSILEPIGYTPRNDREQEVKDRNFNILCWLTEQAGL